MAHGLVLQLKEMLQRNLVNAKEPYEVFSEEEKIIKSWIGASSHPKFFKLEFFCLLRKTLLFVLSPLSLREARKNEMLKAINMYFSKFPNMPRSNQQLYKPLVDVVLDPWKNVFLSWDEFFQRTISFKEKSVQDYFASEPEEIVSARIHSLLRQDKDEMALTLAKNSFLYHSRIVKTLSVLKNPHGNAPASQQALLGSKYRPGTASLDWYLFILQRKKSLPAIISEMDQLTCHEGVKLIQRLRRNRHHNFAFTLLQILLVQDLVKTSNYCCTKKIFSLWCIMQKERKTRASDINDAIRKMLATYAPTSAHFYLFVDALWEQFGSSLITFYVELYIRGLTVDINYLEAARNSEIADDIGYLECQIASMFSKLSTLFSDFHEGAARECMFSAFSLKPTKERLYILQSLTHSILSSENEMKLNCSLNNNVSSQECKCDVRCNGSCKSIKEYYLDHPILKRGISSVPYILVKDLVSVLESVRCTRFQYNIFDWHNNATDLGDYLKDFSLARSWESDTEYASEGSNRSDAGDISPIKNSNYPPILPDKPVLATKRKSESDDPREIFPFDIGANIEISNEGGLNKRIKILDQNTINEVNRKEIFNKQICPIQNINSLAMEDAIENVIRITLDHNKQKSDSTSNNSYLATSLSYTNDGTEKLSLSSVNKQSSENHVYPYTLTSCGERSNLNSSFRSVQSALKSNTESATKFLPNSSKSFGEHETPAVFVTRESVISPTLKYRDKCTAEGQSNNEQSSYKFSSNKISQQSIYCGNSGNAFIADISKKIPVHRQVVTNPVSVSNYEQIRSVHNTAAHTSQIITSKATIRKVINNPVASTSSDLSKIQLLPVTNVSYSNSATHGNANQTKGSTTLNHPAHALTSQDVSNSSVYRSDSRFQFPSHSNVGNTIVKRIDQSASFFQENQVVHCDRSSVIQHTMRQIQESPTRHESTEDEIPNQLAVSVNSTAAEVLRNIPNEDIANLPPFTVTVSGKTISNSSLAIPANLVIARKPHQQPEVVTQAVCNSITSVANKDTITIPGILASPSVIVTPWETRHKNHGKLMYKKNTNAVNSAATEKRIYRYRTPYTKQILVKPEAKAIQQAIPADKNNHLLKALTSPSPINQRIIALPTLNQNNNSSQVWSVNKPSTSTTQGVPQPTSSQPWYSEPFPKPPKREIQPSRNSSTMIEENAVVKSFQPAKPVSTSKTVTTYYKQPNQIHTQNMPSTPVVSHSMNTNFISSIKSAASDLRVPPSINVTSHSVSNKHFLHKDSTSAASSSQSNINANVFSSQSSQISDSQLSTLCADKSRYKALLHQGKKPTAFTTTAVADAKLCHILSNKFPTLCCSPSEINPCQNCSLPTEVKIEQTPSQFTSNLSPAQTTQSNGKMMPDEVLTSNSCDTRIIGDMNDATDLMFSDMNETYTMCPYCSNSYLESELELHVLNDHPKEFGVKNSFASDVESNKPLSENICASSKTLPDVVPEPEPLFHGEPFETDLPQTKSVTSSVDNQNVVDDRNFDDIEVNALNACIDIINNDKDLKRIVQGIGSMEQIENNYLPFMSNISEIPMQNVAKVEQNNECKEYATEFNYPEVGENKMYPVKSMNNVFDFTEKDYESSKLPENLTFKNPSNCTNNIIADNPKDSEELTFSALTEMIKVAIDDSNNVEPCVESCLNNDNENASFPQVNSRKPFSCIFCSKPLSSALSVKRHILKLHPNKNVEDWKSVLQPKICESRVDIGLNSLRNGETLNSVQIDSKCPTNADLPSEPKQNHDISSTSGISTVLPKGRIKGLTKLPTSQCRFCGKVLSTVYMKKHIKTQHSEIEDILKSVKTDNTDIKSIISGNMHTKYIGVENTNMKSVNTGNSYIKSVNSENIDMRLVKTDNTNVNEEHSVDMNADCHNSSVSQLETSNFATASNLPDQDIDSSTCLSVSDALKRNQSFTVSGASSPSHGNNKVADDIKFNFNVLEFPKNSEIDTSKVCHDALQKDSNTHPTPETIIKAEESGIKAKVTYSKQCGFVLHKHLCYICHKTYTAVSSLNKHLKTMHGILDIPRAPRKSRMKNLQKVHSEGKNGKGNFGTSFSEIPTEPRVTSCKETCMQSSNEIPYTLKPIISEHVMHSTPKSVERYKKPMLNCNLLKTVLKSNFVSKQIKEGDLNLLCKTGTTEKSKFQHTDTSLECSKDYVEHAKVQLNERKCLPTFKGSNDQNQPEASINILDPDDQHNPDVVTSVPSQDGEIVNASSSVVQEKDIISECTNSTNVQHNILPEVNVNLQATYPIIGNSALSSQNLSVQSNEISSVSEIISNVSKCQFVGASNDDSEKETFEDNSLKLLIPNNEKESFNNIDKDNKNIGSDIVYKQELSPKQELDCVDDISQSSDNSFSKSNDGITDVDFYNRSDSVEDTPIIAKLSQQEVGDCSLDKNLDIICRLCDCKLSSMESLSQHLKSVHSIPVLKKHTSQPTPSKCSLIPQTSEKRSPPKLKLGTNSSDSESISDYDNVHGSLKTSNENFESETSLNGVTDVLGDSSLSPSSFSESSQKGSSSNITCKIKLAVLENSVSSSSSKQSYTSLISQPNSSNSDSQLKQLNAPFRSCRHRSRRHSFSDAKSFFIGVKKSRTSTFSKPLRYSLSGSVKKKSISLPNIQYMLQHVKSGHKDDQLKNQYTTKRKGLSSHNNTTKFSDEDTESANLIVEENTCLTTVTDTSDEIQILYDSSKNDPVHLNLNSKRRKVSLSKLPASRLKITSRLSSRKLIKRYHSYKRDRRFKKKVKAKYLKRYKSRKAYKPFILTLSEATEISEFLKTHKQPIVKLIRLKDNESRFLNGKNDSALHAKTEHTVKEAVVKLERMHIPNDFGDLFIFNQNFNISNILSRNSHFNSMQSHEKQSENCTNDSHLGSSEVEFSHSETSTMDDNLTEESIELSNAKGFDSDTVVDEHDRKINLIDEEKLLNEECCIFPLKKCSVILKRVSI